MSRLGQIALRSGRKEDALDKDEVDIVTFVEAPWGLNIKPFPVQRVILKALYGIALDDSEKIVEVSDFRRDTVQMMTEAEYLRHLYSQGRCNLSRVEPGKTKQTMVLAVGRRSGKTFLTTCICAYETYKLIKKRDPQAYFGLPPSDVIQLISVATDKDQAGLLYQGVKGHYLRCPFFMPYMANLTQTFATFQTPRDIEVYGPYATSDSKKASIKATFRSCVAEGLRGAGNIVAIMDEMAHFGEGGSSSASEVLTALKPSIAAFSPKSKTDSTIPVGPVESKLIAISSPLGKQGTFYELFQSGFRAGLAADTMLCIQAPTWEVNPTIEPSFLEAEYLADSTKFFTEFGAEFTDRTRGWIERAQDLFDCIDPNLRPQVQAPARRPHFIGLDVGLVGDATAAAICHIDEQQQIVLDLVDSIQAGHGKYANQARLEFDDVVEWVYNLSKRFYLVEGVFDHWHGIAFEQALVKKGLRQLKTKFMTANLISEIWQTFKNMMWDKRIVLYDWPIPEGQEHSEVIQELLRLQADVQSKYVTLVAAPNIDGMHDDNSDAIVRAVWIATQNMGKANYVSRGSGLGPAGPLSPEHAKQQRIAMQKARQLGSSPDRQLPMAMNRTGFGGRSLGRGSSLPYGRR